MDYPLYRKTAVGYYMLLNDTDFIEVPIPNDTDLNCINHLRVDTTAKRLINAQAIEPEEFERMFLRKHNALLQEFSNPLLEN